MAAKKYKILLIEDDIDQISMYKFKFELEGFVFIAARAGAEGIEKAASAKPDLILLDLVLIKENGLDVLEKLKKDVRTKNTPVLILTNLVKKESMERAKSLGAAGYLVKANTVPSSLVKEVKRLLKNA